MELPENRCPTCGRDLGWTDAQDGVYTPSMCLSCHYKQHPIEAICVVLIVICIETGIGAIIYHAIGWGIN